MADIEKHNPNHSSQIALVAEPLVKQLRELIENTRRRVASVVSEETTQRYWNVGHAITPTYSKEAVRSTANKLSFQCHDNWSQSTEVVLKKRICAE